MLRTSDKRRQQQIRKFIKEPEEVTKKENKKKL